MKFSICSSGNSGFYTSIYIPGIRAISSQIRNDQFGLRNLISDDLLNKLALFNLISYNTWHCCDVLNKLRYSLNYEFILILKAFSEKQVWHLKRWFPFFIKFFNTLLQLRNCCTI